MSVTNRVTSLALVAGLVAGGACTNQSSTSAEREPTMLGSEAPAYRDCKLAQHPKAIGSFALNVEQVGVDYDNTFSEILYFTDEHPDLPPTDLATAYITERKQQTAQAVEILFDDGVIQETWSATSEQGGPASGFDLSGEKQLLIGRVDSLLRTLGEYPPELLESLRIQTVKIANKYNNYAGHFDRKNGEILLEMDAFGNTGESLQSLREIVAHELIGHAAHALYCENNIEADVEFSSPNNGYAYIGYGKRDASTPENLDKHYQQVPNKLLKYGPDRMFARAYGATSVAEDFATIIEFTLEKRGVIQPGDSDYGSPLFKKQKLAIDRLEFLMPGFKQFVQNRTSQLRRLPTNEVNVDHARAFVVPSELIPDPATFTDEQEYDHSFLYKLDMVPVLNGAFYDPYDKVRGGVLFAYPAVIINPEGEITMVAYRGKSLVGTSPKGEDTVFRFFKGQVDGGDVILMSRMEFERLATDMAISSPEADEFFSHNPELVISERKQ